MESSKQHKHQPKDNLSSESLHPSLSINQSIDEDRTDAEQTIFDQAEHHFAEAASFRTSSAQLFDETEPFHTPFPTDSSNLTSADDLVLFSTPPSWFLLQQCSPFPSQHASFANTFNDLASTTPTAFLPDLHSSSESNHFASLNEKTPSGVKPMPKNPTTSENEKNIVAEALLGLNALPGIHADGDVFDEPNANQLSGKPSCKCKSSQCLQLYCSCYCAGVHCTEGLCKCKNCLNTASPKLSPSKNHPKNCTCSICSAVINQKLQQVRQKASATSQGCNCKSSHHCLKLYCDCFRSGNLCNPDRCKCVGCKNTAKENSETRRKAIESCLKRRLDAFDARPRKGNTASCSCKKSLCLRKYCVCFANNRACTSACSCIDCLNKSAGVFS